jgi:hypothetical protein
MVPSLYVPVAENNFVNPGATAAVDGFTVSATKVAPLTVTEVEALAGPYLAERVAVPAVWPVTMPVMSVLATLGCDELQFTSEVRFCVLPSLKVPFAVNCCVAPITRIGLSGVMASELNVTGLTFRVVEPVTESKLALIVLLPLFTALAVFPCIVATAVFEEAQPAKPLMYCVEPSLKVAAAANVLVVVGAMEGFAGISAIDVSVAELTVRLVVAVKEPKLAVIVVVPGCWETATLPFMAATDGSEEDHEALVRVCVLPSL